MQERTGESTGGRRTGWTGCTESIWNGICGSDRICRTVLEIGNEAEVNTGYVWVTAENMDDADIKPLVYK